MDMRASDTDRERVVSRLKGHASEGRLDATELEERVAGALAAKSVGELERLEADLPPVVVRQERSAWKPAGEVRAYLCVIALLVAIWALTGAGYFWPVWPALGWGIALFSPGGCAFGAHGRGRRVRSERHAVAPLR